MSRSSPLWEKKENGKKRDLKQSLFRTALAASTQQQWREPWGCSQGRGSGHTRLCWWMCSQSSGLSHRNWADTCVVVCSVHVTRQRGALHKTRKDVETKNFCFLCFSLQRNCDQKNSHSKSKSCNTMCFSPKDGPSSSLSVKQSPLTCLGQDLSINGCQTALSLVVCCRSYGSRVENLSLNESEQSSERLHGSQICLQGIQQFVRPLLFCDIAFMGVEPEYWAHYFQMERLDKTKILGFGTMDRVVWYGHDILK